MTESTSNNSTFLKVVCYACILYTIENITSHILILDTHYKPSSLSINSRIADIILLLNQYINNHISTIIAIGIINLLGILASILSLKKLDFGRKSLIVFFYILWVKSLLTLVHELTMSYVLTTQYPHNNQMSLFLTGYVIYCLFDIASLLFIRWIIKQFKSQPIKDLFQQKIIMEPGKQVN